MSSNLFILDGQNDSILDHINKKYVIFNEHEQDLPTYRDMFRFTVLGDKPYTEHLGKRNGIIAPGEDGELLEFRIFESIKYRDSEGLKVEVYSLATFLDLKNAKIINPHTTSAESAEWHAKQALAGMEWQVGQVDFKGVRSITFDNYTNPYDYLKRIAREFDLELRFYITHDGQKVTGRYVDLVERVGEWRGRTVELGRDLQGIRRIEQTDNVVTALLGVGPEREDGTRLEVFVEDKEALERWGRNGQHIVDVYEPLSERSDMTKEELEQYTRTELNKRINAVVTYEAEILDLENVPGMENKKIRFGDTIRIKDLKFNPALYVEARVHNQVRDVFNKDSKRVVLGDYIEYTEEEVKALFKQMQTEIRKRLERLVLVSIVSSAGNVFKNGVGSTELTAKTFLSGNEVDEDGTKYEYRWHKFDKNGDYVPGFYKEGKTITVNASDIDEKATFRVEIILDDEVLTVHEVTLTNVFDGDEGEEGRSIVDITEYYLATSESSGVTRSTSGWTTTMQVTTPEKRYLWNYEKITWNKAPLETYTEPVIIGVHGEEGQGVENITIEYYLSDSDSSLIGGTWTETKPTYQKNKYLWTRQRITYKNPTEIEYTTPLLDDSWKAIEVAEEAKEDAQEAKQEAQNAMSTADGKNTVFRQENTPPTTNRKIGDLWFKTDEGNKMFVWTGSWTETKLDHQALSVGKLSALSADLGNVTAGDIRGVTMNLANGKFIVDKEGNVTFSGKLEGAEGIFNGTVSVGNTVIDEKGILTEEGDLRVKDDVTQIETSLRSMSNMVNDHSFELVPLGQGSWNYATRRVDHSKMLNIFNWTIGGDKDFARIQSTLGTDDYRYAKFGLQAAILESRYHWLQYVPLDVVNSNAGPYTVSAYFSAYQSTNVPTRCRILVHAYNRNLELVQQNSVGNLQVTVYPGENYVWKRVSHTFRNLPEGTVFLRLRIDQITGDDTRALCDGVQMVPLEYPTIYQPEDSLFAYVQGVLGYIK